MDEAILGNRGGSFAISLEENSVDGGSNQQGLETTMAARSESGEASAIMELGMVSDPTALGAGSQIA